MEKQLKTIDINKYESGKAILMTSGETLDLLMWDHTIRVSAPEGFHNPILMLTSKSDTEYDFEVWSGNLTFTLLPGDFGYTLACDKIDDPKKYQYPTFKFIKLS